MLKCNSHILTYLWNILPNIIDVSEAPGVPGGHTDSLELETRTTRKGPTLEVSTDRVLKLHLHVKS